MLSTRLTVAALALIAGLPLGAAAQEGAPAQPAASQPTTPPTESAPAITFKSTSHDFGKINDEASVTTEFVFENTGTGTLKIDNVRASCGCTAAKPSKEEYAPGETGTITVTLDPSGKRSTTVQTVTVRTNDQTKPNGEVTLKINATVMPMVLVQPATLNFGEVLEGSEGRATVKLLGRNPGFSATYASVNRGRFFTGRVKSNVPVEFEGEQVTESEIEFVTSPNLPRGPFRTSAVVRTTDPKNPLITVEMMGDVVGDLKSSASRNLYLGVVKPGQEFERNFRLNSRSQKPFKIVESRIEMVQDDVAPPDLKVTDLSGQQNDYEVVISGAAPELGKPLKGTIVIRTDIKGDEEYRLTFHALLRPEQPTGGRPNMPAGPGSPRPPLENAPRPQPTGPATNSPAQPK